MLGSPRVSRSVLLLEDTRLPSWLVLFRGTISLVQVLGDTTADSPLDPIFQHSARRWAMCHPRCFEASPDQRALDELQTLLRSNVSDGEALTAYDHAVAELRGQFHAFAVNPPASRDISDVFIWIFELLDDFFPLLKIPTQEAVVIVTYFAILLKKLDSICWMEGWADYLVSWAQNLLDANHQPWISWPLAEIERIGHAFEDKKAP